MYGFANLTTRICVSNCNASTTSHYADAQASRTCVRNCSASPFATFGNLGTSKCVRTCPESTQFGDPFHPFRLCMTTCTNFPNQTFSYFLTRQCVDVCPLGYYGDNYTTAGVGVCTTRCPIGYFGDPLSNLCVVQCPFRYYGSNLESRLCVKTCPYGEYAINLTSTRLCVATCDDGYWADNMTRFCYNIKENCTNNTFADPQKKLCVIGTNCTTLRYADPLTRGCELNCTGSEYIGDPSTNLCVTMCPQNPDTYAQYKKCTGTCANGQYADWQANRTCVTRCSQTPIPLFGNGVNKCVNASSCGTSLFGNNNTQLCSACSGSLPFGDPVTFQCTRTCSANLYGNWNSNLCVATCPFSTLHYADNITGTC